MTFQPQLIQGTVLVLTPDGRQSEAKITIDRTRQTREDRYRPSLILEFLDDTDLVYNLPKLIMDGDLKALSLDFVIRQPSEPVVNQTIINGAKSETGEDKDASDG